MACPSLLPTGVAGIHRYAQVVEGVKAVERRLGRAPRAQHETDALAHERTVAAGQAVLAFGRVTAPESVLFATQHEFAAVAHTLQIDIGEAIRLANRHPRVDILNPGIGVGGHCIPIDPWFIKEVDPTNSRLIFTARMINDEIPTKIAAHIRAAVRGIENPQIIAIGAAYKPDTADTRESPSVEIVRLLRAYGCRVTHFDPLVDGMEFPTTMEAACKDADCLALLVQHKIVMEEFTAKRTEIENVMKTPQILQY